jgi:hypothetical protein
VTQVIPVSRVLGTIVLQELTPSQNVLARAYRNRHVYRGLRERMQTWVMVGMVNARIAPAQGKRRLTITRYVRNERYRLDRGNFVGGCKPLLDAAIRQRLIKDDREEWLDDVYHQAIGQERTEILVEDIEVPLLVD